MQRSSKHLARSMLSDTPPNYTPDFPDITPKHNFMHHKTNFIKLKTKTNLLTRPLLPSEFSTSFSVFASPTTVAACFSLLPSAVPKSLNSFVPLVNASLKLRIPVDKKLLDPNNEDILKSRDVIMVCA